MADFWRSTPADEFGRTIGNLFGEFIPGLYGQNDLYSLWKIFNSADQDVAWGIVSEIFSEPLARFILENTATWNFTSSGKCFSFEIDGNCFGFEIN